MSDDQLDSEIEDEDIIINYWLIILMKQTTILTVLD